MVITPFAVRCASRRAHKFLFASVAWTIVFIAACDPPVACPEPSYAGTATDEVFATLSGRTDAVSGQGPTITAPEADAQYAAGGAAPTFAWDSALVARLMSPGLRDEEPARAAPRTLLQRLSAALWIGTAYAHEPPVTGAMYLARIVAAGAAEDACAPAHVTSELTWPLDDATWADLGSAPGTYSLELVSAYLSEGRITDGPFLATATFVVD